MKIYIKNIEGVNFFDKMVKIGEILPYSILYVGVLPCLSGISTQVLCDVDGIAGAR